MFRAEKNLKDSNSPLPGLPLGKGEKQARLSDGQGGDLSYSKANKLIIALYMVTDIMNKGEPLRNKLRTLGTDIVSDIHSLSTGQTGVHHKIRIKISEIMSFLGIARTLNIISAMNCDILEKEFHELDRSLKESTNETAVIGTPVDLAEFLRDSEEELNPYPASPELRGRSKEGVLSTRLGVQKGETLLKALSRVEGMKALRGVEMPARPIGMSDRSKPEARPSMLGLASQVKGQRRKDILNIIKINGGNATIKDIKDKASTMSPARPTGAGGDKGHSLVSIGEKTLQRELIAMIEDGVLYKEGTKRWSRYFIK